MGFINGVELAGEHIRSHGRLYGFQKGEFNDLLNRYAYATRRGVNKITLFKEWGSTWDAEEIVPVEPPEALHRHPLTYLTEDLIIERELDCSRTANADWSTALTVLLAEPVIEAHQRYSNLLGQQKIVNYLGALFLVDPSISSSARRTKPDSEISSQIWYRKLF
ncbi:hypothetical protein EC973_007101 [Apophysomyces ossiformis]|uniref:Uncharacterized protein n=1 Tax=Apophysomyces ossiformis TaxID=679940 RepID=A0A8H7C0N4_9FUNG|nr:hypothetical protein EC973_007101 [Apophysomyces ossiformis]